MGNCTMNCEEDFKVMGQDEIDRYRKLKNKDRNTNNNHFKKSKRRKGSKRNSSVVFSFKKPNNHQNESNYWFEDDLHKGHESDSLSELVEILGLEIIRINN